MTLTGKRPPNRDPELQRTELVQDTKALMVQDTKALMAQDTKTDKRERGRDRDRQERERERLGVLRSVNQYSYIRAKHILSAHNKR